MRSAQRAERSGLSLVELRPVLCFLERGRAPPPVAPVGLPGSTDPHLTLSPQQCSWGGDLHTGQPADLPLPLAIRTPRPLHLATVTTLRNSRCGIPPGSSATSLLCPLVTSYNSRFSAGCVTTGEAVPTRLAEVSAAAVFPAGQAGVRDV